ncbi:hypothetical protein C8U37_12235 [Trichococcus patagoniensis]|uniref:Uncharacterized protein n=1 Tax=Trichococcus patagoniensis TaxID=382641 RepID=A0A2T5IC79_9LACT|nr:hypothetical protein C8U37_12235 [Trichococcus patagoniensis]
MKKIYLFVHIAVLLLFLLYFVITPRQPLPFSNRVHLFLIISSAAIVLGAIKQNNRISMFCGVSVFALICVSWIVQIMN